MPCGNIDRRQDQGQVKRVARFNCRRLSQQQQVVLPPSEAAQNLGECETSDPGCSGDTDKTSHRDHLDSVIALADQRTSTTKGQVMGLKMVDDSDIEENIDRQEGIQDNTTNMVNSDSTDLTTLREEVQTDDEGDLSCK
jgi:hypothetical protein